MELSAIHPELREKVRKVPHMPLGNRFGRGLFRTLGRLMPTAKMPAGVSREILKTPRPGVRVFRPEQPRSTAALLWIHGGGFMIGTAAQDDRLCGEVCATLGIPVVSVEYRLSPDHPFPAPADDCLAAWQWLQGAAKTLGIDPARIVVGGQSAGGALAAGLVLRLLDAGGVQPLGQWLFAAMFDDRTAVRRDLDAIDHRVWNNKLNLIAWRAFLGSEPGAPGVSPYAAAARREDLSGLPPTWIGVGAIDLFHDEDAAFAARLGRAGVDTTFEAIPGAPHGFEAWAPDTPIARSYVAAGIEWLGRLVGRVQPA